jgi:hypothetical protein
LSAQAPRVSPAKLSRGAGDASGFGWNSAISPQKPVNKIHRRSFSKSDNGERTMKRILLAAGLVLATTSASMAQGYVYGAPYGPGPYAYGQGSGVYDYAPGYGAYDFSPGFNSYSYGGDWYEQDRVDAPGRGNSAESQR